MYGILGISSTKNASKFNQKGLILKIILVKIGRKIIFTNDNLKVILIQSSKKQLFSKLFFVFLLGTNKVLIVGRKICLFWM